jgi:AraC-like DNA-binding protein
MVAMSDTQYTPSVAQAIFVSWAGGCLLIGEHGGVVPMHAHYAVQIAFGTEFGIKFRASDDAPWVAYGGAMIPSRQPHTMDSTASGAWAILFVEPETREGRLLTNLYLREPITAIPDGALAIVRPAMFNVWRESPTTEDLTRAAWSVIQTLTGGVEPSVVSDERILRAIDYINAHLGETLTLDEVAAEAFLSPSRFRHLFVEQTGMALRPYILWRRFLRVWELTAGGASLSAAAHEAGFADAAHLTRTSRRMFGFPPSAMQVSRPLRNSAPTFK